MRIICFQAPFPRIIVHLYGNIFRNIEAGSMRIARVITGENKINNRLKVDKI